MPPLKEIIERCRGLALLARHAKMREKFIRLANDMEQDVRTFERHDAARTNKLAG